MNQRLTKIGIAMIALAAVAAFGAPQVEAGEDLLSRPATPGVATEVSIGIVVIDVSSIDNKDQCFTADFVLRLRWHDPRLALPEGEGGASIRSIDIDTIWHPEVQVLNEKGLKHLMDRHFVDGEGWVVHSQRFYGELRNPMDFRDFPWDQQRLVIEILLMNLPNEIELILDEEIKAGILDTSIPDWDFDEGNCSIRPWTDGPEGVHLLLCEFSCTAQRQTVFFFLKVIVTVTLIFLMAWAVFWIDPSHIAPQIGISTSSIFTLIAFQFTLGYLLPPIPYITRLDRFLVCITLLVFLALGEAVVTTRLAVRDRKDLALKIDRWGRWLFLLAYLLVVLVTVI